MTRGLDCKAQQQAGGVVTKWLVKGLKDNRKAKGLRYSAEADVLFPVSMSQTHFFKVQSKKTTLCKMRGCFRHLVLNN